MSSYKVDGISFERVVETSKVLAPFEFPVRRALFHRVGGTLSRRSRGFRVGRRFWMSFSPQFDCVDPRMLRKFPIRLHIAATPRKRQQSSNSSQLHRNSNEHCDEASIWPAFSSATTKFSLQTKTSSLSSKSTRLIQATSTTIIIGS